VIGVTSSVRKLFESDDWRASDFAAKTDNTGVTVFVVKADARSALLTYARQTRRPSPDTWPLAIDTAPFQKAEIQKAEMELAHNPATEDQVRDRGVRLKLARCPHLLAASLAALPSMSLIPFAPFSLRCSTDDVPGMSRTLGER
jgi:hypothetical protein